MRNKIEYIVTYYTPTRASTVKLFTLDTATQGKTEKDVYEEALKFAEENKGYLEKTSYEKLMDFTGTADNLKRIGKNVI